MRLKIHALNFSMPEDIFNQFYSRLDGYTRKLKNICNSAGTGNDKFTNAFTKLASAIHSNQELSVHIDSPIMVRAFAVSLLSEFSDQVVVNQSVIDKINIIRPNPSTLLIENLYQFYLLKFDNLPNSKSVSDWLIYALDKKGRLQKFQNSLLNDDGPKWLAHYCIDNDYIFDEQLEYFELDRYQSGRFLTIAKGIYFIEQLRTIPLNKPHDLLNEVQNPSTYDSRYDDSHLLGHKILQIIIERSPDKGVDDSWLNVVLAIAGDPRVPRSHSKYQKWWSQLDSSLNIKVRGWLSKLDLRLFLEALENYSNQSGNDELKRMFPSRKNFLEGLEKKDLISDTRLYLSYGAIQYLHKNYDPKHLPKYSRVSNSDKSIIHVRIGDSHLVEGSHSCYLWIYPRLDPTAVVFNYDKTDVSYYELTGGLNTKMQLKGTPSSANITHSPTNFSWQKNAISALNNIGVNIKAKDVLSDSNYSKYIRIHGVG